MSLALDDGAKQALRDDGYVLLPGIIPRPLVDRALRAINHSLGNEGIAKADLPQLRARTFTPELVRSDDVCALFTESGVRAAVESVLGRGKVAAPKEAQIALRFPTLGPPGPAWPHIDGIPSVLNGVPAGTLYHFTALLGVFLSDTTGPDQGNLTVWPGSHHLVAEHFRKHGPAGMVGGFPTLPLGPPRPVLARAGDAILAHYQLAHGVGPNVGPHVRYAAFFRLSHVDHANHGTRPLTEPWLEWPGIRALTP